MDTQTSCIIIYIEFIGYSVQVLCNLDPVNAMPCIRGTYNTVRINVLIGTLIMGVIYYRSVILQILLPVITYSHATVYYR